MRTAIIHQLQLPQGRFERRIHLPAGLYSAIHRSHSNGHMLITLEKSGPPMAEAEISSEGALGAAPSPPLPPDALIIVPVRGLVLFPATVLPITLGRAFGACGAGGGAGAKAGRHRDAAQR